MDARPSDAVALAVRLDVPIYAAVDVLDRAAKLIDLEGNDDDDPAGADEGPGGARRASGRPVPLETPGGPVDAASL